MCYIRYWIKSRGQQVQEFVPCEIAPTDIQVYVASHGQSLPTVMKDSEEEKKIRTLHQYLKSPYE